MLIVQIELISIIMIVATQAAWGRYHSNCKGQYNTIMELFDRNQASLIRLVLAYLFPKTVISGLTYLKQITHPISQQKS